MRPLMVGLCAHGLAIGAWLVLGRLGLVVTWLVVQFDTIVLGTEALTALRAGRSDRQAGSGTTRR